MLRAVAGPARFAGAVFDFDGLLVDTGQMWNRAFTAAATTLGVELGSQDLMALAGRSVRGAADIIATRGDARPQQVEAHIHQSLMASFDSAAPTLMPGAALLVETLHGRVPLAVASNSPTELLRETLGARQLADAFDAIIGAEDVIAHKPEPEPYLAACARLSVNPTSAVAFEDSPVGAAAATAAGLSLVIVSADQWPQPTNSTGIDRPVLRVQSLCDQAIFRFLTAGVARDS